MDVFSQRGLEEFLSYLNGLMEEAFYPYTGLYHGRWNATELRKECEMAYAEACEKKDGCQRIGRRLAKTLDDKTLDYLMRHFQGVIYGPDLAIFGDEIAKKLQEITAKAGKNGNL